MSVLPLEHVDSGVLGTITPLDQAIARARRHVMRYRLLVLAHDAAEVVARAGGWLFDRSLAGWDITVLLEDVSHASPVRILGGVVVDLRSAVEAMALEGPLPQAFAVIGDLEQFDEPVRQWIAMCLDRGRCEVTLWGDTSPTLTAKTEAQQHHPTTAAAAFKVRALAALAGTTDSVSGVEQFRRAGTPPRPVADSEA